VGAGIRGWRIQQVSITHLPRPHGPSTVNLKALVRLTSGAVAELALFRLRLARKRPVG
jgi:hypothetical protein